jgi:tRNA(adenine34) deaminase
MIHPSELIMRAAIAEALKAKKNDNYSIGAVIIKGDEIIARSPNVTRSKNDPTKHAEIEVIRKALKKTGCRFLEGCVLYTTHEPCPMCATAAVWVKLDSIVFGAKMSDMINHSLTSSNDKWKWRTVNIAAREVLAKGFPKVKLIGGFLRKECLALFH